MASRFNRDEIERLYANVRTRNGEPMSEGPYRQSQPPTNPTNVAPKIFYLTIAKTGMPNRATTGDHRLLWWSATKWTLEQKLLDALGDPAWRMLVEGPIVGDTDLVVRMLATALELP